LTTAFRTILTNTSDFSIISFEFNLLSNVFKATLSFPMVDASILFY
jgi:hypothetical protein